MAWWKHLIDLNELNARCKGTLSGSLGILFTKVGPEGLVATMPVESHHLQPMGILHGGASCVFAETVGTAAGWFCVDTDLYTCVGLNILVNHMRPVSEGLLTACATPLHLGKTTQVWSVQISNEKGQLTAVSQFTVAVIEKKR